MTQGSIFLLRDGELVEMAEQVYDTEDLLQRYLEQHPALLAGEQMDPDAPRRWVVVSREIAMAGEERGVGRVDHAFLDQDGIPTLVEVKRSSDTRIRREVVGQMLDYAANAVVYWPSENIRTAFEANCAAAGRDADEAIRALVESDMDEVDEFWNQVKANLERGRIRLVFVADRIPAELKRIVEFLNEQMSPAEVFAVEVVQYLDGESGYTGLVPRLVGNTLAAERKKAPRRQSRIWDAASVFERIQTQLGDDQCRAAQEIYQWAETHVTTIRWGTGAQDGSFILEEAAPDGRCPFLAVYTSGHVELRFGSLMEHGPFRDEGPRRDIVARLNTLSGIDLPADAHERRRNMSLAAFVDLPSRSGLIDLMGDIVTRLRTPPARSAGDHADAR